MTYGELMPGDMLLWAGKPYFIIGIECKLRGFSHKSEYVHLDCAQWDHRGQYHNGGRFCYPACHTVLCDVWRSAT